MMRGFLHSFALAAFALAVITPLAGCNNLPDPTGAPPAPLEQTVIDEKALTASWAALDFIAATVDQLIDLGQIQKGTPRGDAIKRALLATQSALNAATDAKNALSASSYAKAMLDAKASFTELAKLLKGE